MHGDRHAEQAFGNQSRELLSILRDLSLEIRNPSLDTSLAITEADASAQEAMRIYCESATELRNETAGWRPLSGSDATMAVARMGHASVQILWRGEYSNTLKDSALRIRCFEGALAIPGRPETNGFDLNELGGERYEPVRTRSLELRWRLVGGTGQPLSSEEIGHRATLMLAESAQTQRSRLL